MSASDSDRTQVPDPAGEFTLDSAALRVLAHPMRITLLNELRRQGPATARQLARRFELDSGAASYHLRRLAAGGLIEEDTGRGNRRERWWRALHRASQHDPAERGGGEGRAYAQAVALAAAETLRRVAAHAVPGMPDAWFAASAFSDVDVDVTPDELRRLKEELHAVVARYRDRPPSRGAARATVQIQVFPAAEVART
ncbi:helix-turn-helix domain-containing protein [Streptomyces sp. VRA16 Mangrove soil]|uniref:winged helix-turn-helix domain-containing protein n=1 Tax=Streptomyces sp. VRA16 Mangrove soil TaxID=2817434 RepID=UPI001A9F036D|nr:helix-turn-helix domain-containing protein [Streptomyces sp. VRA16 Mangrove soil]MBO1334558.1 helix-turn-helix transcriptional regulator [Streptomyces sp. VRA16 Mangrove soil]